MPPDPATHGRSIVLRDGVSISVRLDGPADGHPLVLLHGFPESCMTWSSMAPHLFARGYRTVAPDLRGHGLSDAPRGRRQYHVDALVKDVLGVIDQVGGPAGAGVDVVGHDWGGALTWVLAQRHPDRVRTAVIVAAPHPRVLQRAVLVDRDQRRRSRYVLGAQLPFAPERRLRRDGYAALLGLFGSSLPPDERALLRECWARPGVLTGMLNYYRALMTSTASPLDRQPIDVPLLLVTGDRDRLFGSTVLDESLRLASAARHVPLAEVGHSPHRDAPDRLAELVDDHVRSVAG